MIEVIEISKQEYIEYFNNNNEDNRLSNFIDIESKNDKYFYIKDKDNDIKRAFFALDYQKKFIQLNGLFSLYKGYGAKVIEYILNKYFDKFIRINYKTQLDNYYSQFGFKKYLSIGDYCEALIEPINPIIDIREFDKKDQQLILQYIRLLKKKYEVKK